MTFKFGFTVKKCKSKKSLNCTVFLKYVLLTQKVCKRLLQNSITHCNANVDKHDAHLDKHVNDDGQSLLHSVSPFKCLC